MKLNRIHQIINWFAGSGLRSFELSEGDARIRLERPPNSAPVPHADLPTAPPASPPPAQAEPEVESDSEIRIEAPVYGVCFLSSAPGEPPLVQPGRKVVVGDTLCLIEAMKVLNAVTAPCDGIVACITASDGAEVEQGETLMVLK